MLSSFVMAEKNFIGLYNLTSHSDSRKIVLKLLQSETGGEWVSYKIFTVISISMDILTKHTILITVHFFVYLIALCYLNSRDF